MSQVVSRFVGLRPQVGCWLCWRQHVSDPDGVIRSTPVVGPKVAAVDRAGHSDLSPEHSAPVVPQGTVPAASTVRRSLADAEYRSRHASKTLRAKAHDVSDVPRPAQ